MKYVLSVAILGAAGVAAMAVPQMPTVRASDARSHIGKQVVVHDSVAQVVREIQSGFTYLNFVAEFPYQPFTAIVPESIVAEVRADQLEGRWVRVTGTPRLGRDSVPEILCDDPAQVAEAAPLKAVPVTPRDPTPAPRRNCCRICTTGKACGNSCIARNRTCRQPPGCACNG